MLVQYLTKGGTKDLLVPHFRFHTVMHTESETRIFEEIARLRYDVYCAECKYLDETEFEAGLETDGFEDRSVHVAAQNAKDEVIGTVRLVLATQEQEFPFEEHCTVFPDLKLPPKAECGEVSRLIVKRTFRRRPGDSMQGVSKEFQDKGDATSIAPPTGITGKERRSSSPEIMIGMYREIFRYSIDNGIRYWYAAMEKGLARLLDRMGFHFVPVGPETDYYGPVTTYIADLRELEVALAKTNPFLLAWFRGDKISDWMLISTMVKYKLGMLGKL